MPLNIESKTSHFFVENGMMIINNYPWNPDGDNGKPDAIWRTEDARRAYPKAAHIFIFGIISCWEPKIARGGKNIYFGYRFPGMYERMDMSRDHLVGTLAMISRVYGKILFKSFYSRIPWRFSMGFRKSIDLHLWAKALSGNTLSEILYILFIITEVLVIFLWNTLWRALIRIKREVSQEEYMKNRAKYKYLHDKRKWWIKTFIVPTYGLVGKAEQIECLDKSIGKWIISKLMLLVTPRHNYFMQMLLGHKPPKNLVWAYRSQTGGRWSAEYTIANDRDFEYNHDSENRLDEDLVRQKYIDKFGLE